ncbi:MAG: hypothetical protein PHU56_00285 [Candidatus Pacebacteria bacterium]|nr:hypothetical protein [Candidatus Paceibacterota bacterium]
MNEKDRIKIKSKVTANGLAVGLFKKEYCLAYPKGIFGCLNEKERRILAENFLFCRLGALGLSGQKHKIEWDFKKPFFYDFVDYGLKKDLARICQENKIDQARLEESWKAGKKNFLFIKTGGKEILGKRSVNDKKIILAMSFGKDSLLSYALAKELGFDVLPVFVREMENVNPRELKRKESIMKAFQKNEGRKTKVLLDNMDEALYRREYQKEMRSADNANAMLAFAMELLPFAYSARARYIVMGNEQNFNDSFVNRCGRKAYPSFDQSAAYLAKMNQRLDEFTDNTLRCLSLVEPLYNIAEYKIFFNRYPDLLQYNMSCDLEKAGGAGKWCLGCTMCASSFLSSWAVGGRPEQMGIKEDMFKPRYRDLYIIFGGRQSSYDMPPAIMEEQMLEFLLAMKNGAKGHLMELFKKKFLRQALAKEACFRKKYFGIHSSDNIPRTIRTSLLKIFKQELKSLQ